MPEKVFKIEAIVTVHEPEPEAVAFKYYLEGKEMADYKFTLTTNQTKTILAQPVDPSGKPAPISGVPTYTVAPDGIVGLVPSPDGLSVAVTGLMDGSATVTGHGVSVPGNAFATPFTAEVIVEAVAFVYSEGGTQTRAATA